MYTLSPLNAQRQPRGGPVYGRNARSYRNPPYIPVAPRVAFDPAAVAAALAPALARRAAAPAAPALAPALARRAAAPAAPVVAPAAPVVAPAAPVVAPAAPVVAAAAPVVAAAAAETNQEPAVKAVVLKQAASLAGKLQCTADIVRGRGPGRCSVFIMVRGRPMKRDCAGFVPVCVTQLNAALDETEGFCIAVLGSQCYVSWDGLWLPAADFCTADNDFGSSNPEINRIRSALTAHTVDYVYDFPLEVREAFGYD